VRLVELRLVRALRRDVPDDALEPSVDDERGLTAGTGDFEFGSQLGHGALLDWFDDYDTDMTVSRRAGPRRVAPARGRGAANGAPCV
jgi:hypothetical protein